MSTVAAAPPEITMRKRPWRFSPDRLAASALAMVCGLWLWDYFRGFGLFYHKGWLVLIAVAMLSATIIVMLVWWLGSLLFHGRFQFRIRSLLLLTVAIAITRSWFAAALAQSRRQAATIEWACSIGMDSRYDWDDRSWDGAGAGFPRIAGPPPNCLANAVGVDFFSTPTTIGIGRSSVDVGSEIQRLAEFAPLWHLELDGPYFTDPQMERLLPEISDFRYHDSHRIGAGLRLLGPILRPHWISVRSASLDVRAINTLAAMPWLRKLSFDSVGFSDDAVASFERLTQLRELRFDGGYFPAEILRRVGRLTNLRALRISNVIGDDELRPIVPLVQLEELDLSHNNLSDDAIRQLANYPQLRSLDLSATNVKASGIRLLGDLTMLHSLKDGESSRLTDADLKTLPALAQVESIDMASNLFTDESLESLVKMTNLRELDINNSNITSTGAESLRQTLSRCQIHYTSARPPPSATGGAF